MRPVVAFAAAATAAFGTVLVSCAGMGRPPDPGGSPVLGVFERTGCLGACPAYRITVHENGVLLFQRLRDEAGGNDREPLRGRRLSRRELASLTRAFESAGFASMSDYDRDDCTDYQMVTIEWRGHTVVHYWGDQHAPKGLYDLEGTFDRIADSRRWLGTDPHTAGPYFTYCDG